MPPVIREASIQDLHALAALELACYPPASAETRAEIRASFRQRAIRLAWDDGGILGCVCATWHVGWRRGEVTTVSVHPDARGQGIARVLLDRCLDRLAGHGARRAVLQVNASNRPAILLYESMGWRFVRRLEGWYRTWPNPDALLYAVDLGQRASIAATSSPTPSTSGSTTGTAKRAR